MQYFRKEYREEFVVADYSLMTADGYSTQDYNIVFKLQDNGLSFPEECENLTKAMSKFIKNELPEDSTVVFCRVFLSDISNQHSFIEEDLESLGLETSISYVQQPPLDSHKVEVWMNVQTNCKKFTRNGFTVVERNGYTHLFGIERSSLSHSSECPYKQTADIFESFGEKLTAEGGTLLDNCIRTWIYVRDVDEDYHDVVVARKEFFQKNNLTEETHFIASTGIEGAGENTWEKVLLDTYSVIGINGNQIQFLYASDFINRTIDYGVTFERGVVLKYGDRKKVYISGTASIDNKGKIMFLYNIKKQCQRVIENVSALLSEAGCDFSDIGHAVIYVRDIADYNLVSVFFEEKLPHVPKSIVLGPICRPGWLVEMECIVSAVDENEGFENY